MRLIDADVLKTKILECSKNCFSYGAYGEYYNGKEAAYLDTADLIDEAPIFIEERKHGRWIKHNNIISCNECIWDMYWEEGNKELNYCPNCGAKMENNGGNNNAE